MNHVIVAEADDSPKLLSQLRDALPGEAVTFAGPTDPLPDTWTSAVALFVVTPQALQRPDLEAFVRRVAEQKLPLVPVVENLNTFDFASIPANFSAIGERNAEGLQPGDGRRVVEAVRNYLGLEVSLREQRKVFISYRRSDAEATAEQIFEDLWAAKYFTFLDKNQLPAGEVVQSRVMSSLAEMDFVLLIDSPDAGRSPWVMAEVTYALERGIPVCAVGLDPSGTTLHLPIAGHTLHLFWDPALGDAENLRRVRLLVARGLARRNSLDRRLERTLGQFAAARGAELAKLDGREYRLMRGGQRVVVQYEDAPVSLERLHRLYKGYADANPCQAGLFVSGDWAVPAVTVQAVAWACNCAPLQALPLTEAVAELARVFK
jgi:hypothetical protein